jgi:D-alanine-D-alanine ligase
VIHVTGLKKSRVGVLMGGLSGEREVSLRSGANCLTALESLGYDATGIDVGHDIAEKLHTQGVEVAFLALHGKYGEDGSIQGLLEMLGIPYTGSRVLASAVGMNKVYTKQIASWHGVPTPKFAEFFCGAEDEREAVSKAARDLVFPVMLKPSEEGSSLGVVKLDSAAEFKESVGAACSKFRHVLAEEFISGDEVTVGLLEDSAGLTAFPVLQLIPKSDFYDFEAKYSHGMTEFVVPAKLPDEITSLCQRRAKTVHRAVGCRGFSRVDFIIDSQGEPWLTEINTLPGMTDTSDFPAQAKAAGMSYGELVEKMLASALL